MARPRVFVSSTFYDLKHIRSSLEDFIESLGFDPVLFEKGSVAYHPDNPLDDSCYREAANADIFVLIIGGRYGSPASSSGSHSGDEFESITRKEFETAQDSDVPTFILIDASVASEYRTYLKNRNNNDIVYAHVDSPSVFKLIESVLSKTRNNPVFHFEKATHISGWLREQWSGLFRELLRSRSQQRQFSTLNSEILELKSVNDTLKKYLEAVLNTVDPLKSGKIIEEESEKLEKAQKILHFRNNRLFRFFERSYSGPPTDIDDLFINPTTADEAIEKEIQLRDLNENEGRSVLITSAAAQNDYNDAREALGLPAINFKSASHAHASATAIIGVSRGEGNATRTTLRKPSINKIKGKNIPPKNDDLN